MSQKSQYEYLVEVRRKPDLVTVNLCYWLAIGYLSIKKSDKNFPGK